MVRADVVKVTISSFSIVEHLDVLKQIDPGLDSRAIAYAVDTFSLKIGEEAPNDSVVVSVAGSVHVAGDAVPGKLVTSVVARVLAAAIRVVNQRSSRSSSPYLDHFLPIADLNEAGAQEL